MARIHYLSHWLYTHNVPLLPRLCMLLIRLMYMSFLPPRTVIGKGVKFGHAFGIAIAGNTKIGNGCKIRHGCTLANNKSGAPTLGDNVDVGCNSTIIGPVKIGDGACVGAGAVVVDDVPAHSTVVGVPARVVRMRAENSEWLAKARATVPPRDAHVERCKICALKLLQTGDVRGAMATMVDGLRKHPETYTHRGTVLGEQLLEFDLVRDPQDAYRFINGFR